MTDIHTLLVTAKADIATLLPKGGIPVEQARQILRQYTAAIEGNFVAWMGTAAITARSVQGRYAASENLWVEMKDDHAGMLRAFARGAGAEPGVDEYQRVDGAVQSVRAMVGEMSGVKNLALMAVLENTSAVFIPWLATLGAQAGATDLTYTDVHGEADIAHADQFVWALEHEAWHYESAEKDIAEAVNMTTQFLKSLFAI